MCAAEAVVQNIRSRVSIAPQMSNSASAPKMLVTFDEVESLGPHNLF